MSGCNLLPTGHEKAQPNKKIYYTTVLSLKIDRPKNYDTHSI